MARSEAKRRRQLEKKKQKRSQKKHELVRQQNAGLGEKLLRRATAPVQDCLIGEALEVHGIGNVIISRKSASGEYALACVLVDRYCMGVKDCFAFVCNGTEYRERLERIHRDLAMRRVDAPTARRVIEDAVAFAHDLGLSPHRDYRVVKQIFGDIDSTLASETFEMGKDGKPLFMPGPYQSAEETRMIMAKLSQSRGVGEYDYILPMRGSGDGFGDAFDEHLVEIDEHDLRSLEFSEDR